MINDVLAEIEVTAAPTLWDELLISEKQKINIPPRNNEKIKTGTLFTRIKSSELFFVRLIPKMIHTK